MAVEFRQLEYFVKAATLGNISRAAEVLHISQPAISKGIHLLEEDVGIPLFERSGKHISLNDAGKCILEDAREILDKQRIIYQKCQQNQMHSPVHITLMSLAASELLPELLDDFQTKNPKTAITVLQSSRELQSADVLISSVVRGCDGATHRSVLCEDLGIAMSAAHPLARQNSVSLRELADHPIISLQAGHDMRMIEDHYARLADVTFQHMIECDSPATMRSLIKRGLGPALVPTRTWPSMQKDQTICVRPIRNQKCVRYINVQIIDPDHASPAVYALFDHIATFFSTFDSTVGPMTAANPTGIEQPTLK